jgi:hypothetical protein
MQGSFVAPELIKGLSELFQVSPSVIYSDLRGLEPQVGCLLANAQESAQVCTSAQKQSTYARSA